MTEASLLPTLLVTLGTAVAAAGAGVLVGRLYFAALGRTVALYIGDGDTKRATALTVARIAGAVAFLVLAAELGAVALLAAGAGLLIARGRAIRNLGEAA